MRYGELEEGIDVLDSDGNLVGSSRIAARHALLETALTRVVLPMPILVLPPIVMSMLEKTALLQARPRLLLPVQSLVCLAAFGLALPLAISLFPQMSEREGGQKKKKPEMSIKKTKQRGEFKHARDPGRSGELSRGVAFLDPFSLETGPLHSDMVISFLTETRVHHAPTTSTGPCFYTLVHMHI